MGYKLAGFTVLGGVEIDPEMMDLYRTNHNPKHSFLMGVQKFKNIPDNELPKELFDLDILDGSPPCSSFSSAGSRDKAWGLNKKFREGQAHQVLDDLFFHFIDIAKKLQPKIVVAENVKGLVTGKAKGYVKEIYNAFEKAGYDVQLFLLNAAFMGVPQRRERTFFVARQKNLGLSKIKMEFNEPVLGLNHLGEISASIFKDDLKLKLWSELKRKAFGKNIGSGTIGRYDAKKFISYDQPAFTQTSTLRHYHPKQARDLVDQEIIFLQSFPTDFNFKKTDAQYVCGMSVPPFMMQRVANQIYEQWLKNLDHKTVSDPDQTA
jgi:DNA (cytosine-5)-methyltransferase 1